MKLLKSFFSENARHFLLMSVCFVMATGLFSCNSDDVAFSPVDGPAGTDDASLLAWQMEKMVETKGASSYVVWVTTGKEIKSLKLICNGDYSIDWGDGVVENNTLSHIYTDGEPAHTIFIYGDFNGVGTEIYVGHQNLIYADISRCPDLKSFNAPSNRLTNIDLTKNTGLESLWVGWNKLSFVDLSNILSLKNLDVSGNPITNIDVTKFPNLEELSVSGTLIQNLDILNNKELRILNVFSLPITSIDIKNFPKLAYFNCFDSPIDELDFSENTTMVQLGCDNTNITNLDLSNAKDFLWLSCNNCNINDITFHPAVYRLYYVNIKNNPIEQNIRKMTSIALSLPDRSKTNPGSLVTSTPHLSTITSLLEGYNWDINP